MKKLITVSFIAIALLVSINNVGAQTVEPEFSGGHDSINNSEPKFTGGNDTIDNTEPEFTGGHDTIDNNPTTPVVDDEPEFTGGHDTIDTPVVPVVEAPADNGSGRSSSTGGSSRRNRTTTTTTTVPTTPTVLGAATGPNGEALACAPYLVTFMRIGQANNVEEVKKLQSYLNESIDAKLPVTGFFGPLTHKSVMALQAKFSNEILKPWDIAGLSTNLQPTGYAYKMTQWFINTHKCPDVKTPAPVLK